MKGIIRSEKDAPKMGNDSSEAIRAGSGICVRTTLFSASGVRLAVNTGWPSL